MGLYASNAGAGGLWGERHLQQDRQVVGDAAGVAGVGVGAEGFLAGMDGVAREQEGYPKYLHPGTGRWILPPLIRSSIDSSQ